MVVFFTGQAREWGQGGDGPDNSAQAGGLPAQPGQVREESGQGGDGPDNSAQAGGLPAQPDQVRGMSAGLF